MYYGGPTPVFSVCSPQPAVLRHDEHSLKDAFFSSGCQEDWHQYVFSPMSTNGLQRCFHHYV